MPKQLVDVNPEGLMDLPEGISDEEFYALFVDLLWHVADENGVAEDLTGDEAYSIYLGVAEVDEIYDEMAALGLIARHTSDTGRKYIQMLVRAA